MNKPYFEKAPSILNKPDGSVLFECMVQANPQPEVAWFLQGQPIAADDRHVMRVRKIVGKYACTLQIKEPERADQGIYKAVATNQHGSTEVEQHYVVQCTANTMFPEGPY